MFQKGYFPTKPKNREFPTKQKPKTMSNSVVSLSVDETLLIRDLKVKIGECQAGNDEMKKTFFSDFEHSFKFYSTEMFVNTIWIKHLNYLLECVEKKGDLGIAIDSQISIYNDYLKIPHNVRTISLSHLHIEASILTYQTYINMLKFLSDAKIYYPTLFSK